MPSGQSRYGHMIPSGNHNCEYHNSCVCATRFSGDFQFTFFCWHKPRVSRTCQRNFSMSISQLSFYGYYASPSQNLLSEVCYRGILCKPSFSPWKCIFTMTQCFTYNNAKLQLLFPQLSSHFLTAHSVSRFLRRQYEIATSTATKQFSWKQIKPEAH